MLCCKWFTDLPVDETSLEIVIQEGEKKNSSALGLIVLLCLSCCHLFSEEELVFFGTEVVVGG
jgi:hypothetical protein